MMVLFSISLIISILIHEAGHAIAAKLCNCGITEIAIGFGKPLFKKKIGNTVYQICPILLGGYVKLKDELIISKDPHAFTNLPYHKKFAITVAGVIVNILMGLISLYLGKIILNYQLFYFGYLSLILGITNLLPIPAFDGSYIFLVWLEKFFGKEKGYRIMEKVCRIGFIVIMIINILCLPLLIYYVKTGVL